MVHDLQTSIHQLQIMARNLLRAKHDPSRNGYQKKYQKKRYHERMTEAKKLLGGKCSVCSSTKSLELDHKNPDNKSFNVSDLWSCPEDEFKREVRKCRLLCRKHHLENTGKQRENGEVKSKPGKSEYGKDKRKKASARLAVLASSLVFEDAAKLGASLAKEVAATQEGVQALMASAFKKQKAIGLPVLTWSAFDKDDGYQLLFRIYGREKNADMVSALVQAVKQTLPTKGASLEYEDDLSEPGLIVKVVSGHCA